MSSSSALRPDLDVQMLRGNVDTRLRKLAEGACDVVILAEAGVRRLGLTVTAARLEGVMVPAVAQGARSSAAPMTPTPRCLAALHDRRAALETAAERAVMRALGGRCTVPMGALARWDEATGALAMEGYDAREDGSAAARRSHAGRAKGSARRRGPRAWPDSTTGCHGFGARRPPAA